MRCGHERQPLGRLGTLTHSTPLRVILSPSNGRVDRAPVVRSLALAATSKLMFLPVRSTTRLAVGAA